MSEIERLAEAALGLSSSAQGLTIPQLMARAFIVFFALLGMLRVAGRRFLAWRSPLDALVGLILASMLSNAIIGSAAFGGALVNGFFVAALYRAVAYAASRYPKIGYVLKGEPMVVVEDGQANHHALRTLHMSEHDLGEDLRLVAGVEETREVQRARVERNGETSVVRKPRMIEVAIENGVKSVRVIFG